MSDRTAGFIVKSRPRPYKLTPQQVMFREACRACGIQKGVSRRELVEAMVTCMPEWFRKQREEEHA